VNDRSAKGVSIILRIVIFAIALGASASFAAELIGTVSSVNGEVTRSGGGALKSGDSVSQGEVIKSSSGGSAKISFSDGTSMSIGSSAQVTLSHFVYADKKKTFQKASFDLAKGAFRFATGSSDKSAYEVKTPTSTLSVRGTVWTMNVTEKKTTINVISGTVVFCQGGKCRVVEAGQSAGDDDSSDSDPGGQSNPPPAGPRPPTAVDGYTPKDVDQCTTANCDSPH
jgi:hypothetical protein